MTQFVIALPCPQRHRQYQSEIAKQNALNESYNHHHAILVPNGPSTSRHVYEHCALEDEDVRDGNSPYLERWDLEGDSSDDSSKGMQRDFPDGVYHDDDKESDSLSFTLTFAEKTPHNLQTTKAQAVVPILTYIIHASLSCIQVDGRLKLVNSSLGCEVLHATKYMLRKISNLKQSRYFKFHHF